MLAIRSAATFRGVKLQTTTFGSFCPGFPQCSHCLPRRRILLANLNVPFGSEGIELIDHDFADFDRLLPIQLKPDPSLWPGISTSASLVLPSIAFSGVRPSEDSEALA